MHSSSIISSTLVTVTYVFENSNSQEHVKQQGIQLIANKTKQNSVTASICQHVQTKTKAKSDIII